MKRPKPLPPVEVERMTDIEAEIRFQPTGWATIDTMLGGGLARIKDLKNKQNKRSLVYLLGAEPGTGKTTLLLQLADRMAQNGFYDEGKFYQKKSLTILYISTEQDIRVLKSRCNDFSINNEKILLASTTFTRQVSDLAYTHAPNVIVVDAVQPLHDPSRPGAPGHARQLEAIREVMVDLTRAGVSCFLVGHSTKQGKTDRFAGTQHMQHMVDAVFWMKRDPMVPDSIILHAKKNRVGPTDIEARFKMRKEGLSQGEIYPRME